MVLMLTGEPSINRQVSLNGRCVMITALGNDNKRLTILKGGTAKRRVRSLRKQAFHAELEVSQICSASEASHEACMHAAKPTHLVPQGCPFVEEVAPNGEGSWAGWSARGGAADAAGWAQVHLHKQLTGWMRDGTCTQQCRLARPARGRTCGIETALALQHAALMHHKG